MPRRARTLLPNHYFHVINRAAGKAPLFTRPRDYREFLRILREGLARHPAPLVAYCIMANHWHLIIGPTGTGRLSRLIHWVSTTHAVRFRLRLKTIGDGPVYQGRFKARPVDESGDLVMVCRYVERNALTAGLVRRAQDWPWGSLADRLRPDPALPLTGAEFLTSEAWVSFVNAMLTRKDHAETPVPKRGRAAENRPVPKRGETVENRPVPSEDVAEAPGVGERGEERVGVRRRAHEDQAHAHVERPEHLRIVQLAGALQPREQRGNRPSGPVKHKVSAGR